LKHSPDVVLAQCQQFLFVRLIHLDLLTKWTSYFTIK
jgi:hypothetical protein